MKCGTKLGGNFFVKREFLKGEWNSCDKYFMSLVETGRKEGTIKIVYRVSDFLETFDITFDLVLVNRNSRFLIPKMRACASAARS